MFSSNRPNDTLKTEAFDTTLLGRNFDLFYLPLDVESKVLGRITYTEYADERQPMQYNDSLYTFLSDKNGITNRYVGHLDNIFLRNDTVVFFADSIVANPTWSVKTLQQQESNGIDSVMVNPVYKLVGVTYPNSNYSASVLEHDVAPRMAKSAQLFKEKGKYRFHIASLDLAPVKTAAPKLKNTVYMDWLILRDEAKRKAQENAKRPTTAVTLPSLNNVVVDEPLDTTPPPPPFFQNNFNTAPAVAVDGYYGEVGFNEDGTPDGTITEYVPEPVFQYNQVRPYRVKFSQDYILTQVDNSLIMTRYEQYRPGTPVFNNPDLSATINLGISDLMEDHKITAGFRFPFNFQRSEYFIAYESLKKRLDKKIMYYRRVDNQS
jgi:hypothetical protein